VTPFEHVCGGKAEEDRGSECARGKSLPHDVTHQGMKRVRKHRQTDEHIAGRPDHHA
jgi:hypothetical protein